MLPARGGNRESQLPADAFIPSGLQGNRGLFHPFRAIGPVLRVNDAHVSVPLFAPAAA